MYCEKCGRRIDDNSAFCTACGAKIARNTADTNASPEIKTVPDVKSVPAKKKKSGGGKSVVVWIVVLLIIGIVNGIMESHEPEAPGYDPLPDTTYQNLRDRERVTFTLPVYETITKDTVSVTGKTTDRVTTDIVTTDMVTTTTAKSEPEPEPWKWEDHVYTQAMNAGTCETLTGKVLFFFIFVEDNESKWDDASRKAAEDELVGEMKKLKAEAESFGETIEFYYKNNSASYSGTMTKDNADIWKEDAVRDLGFSSLSSVQTQIEKEGYDSVPIIYVLNKSGRAYANSRSTTGGYETVVIYSDELYALRHEVLHLYGAPDFYYPDVTVGVAEKYLPDSIMMNSEEGQIDDLTAFLIGWKDDLSASAESFLDETGHLTEADMEDARKIDQQTGYGTKRYGKGTYTGYMVFGVPSGEGKIELNNGDFCEGTFANGKLNGRGRYVWADGNTYEGDFVYGSMTGYGVFTWTNGDVYEGEVVDGSRTGYGVYRWANGNSKEGYWDNGTFVS